VEACAFQWYSFPSVYSDEICRVVSGLALSVGLVLVYVLTCAQHVFCCRCLAQLAYRLVHIGLNATLGFGDLCVDCAWYVDLEFDNTYPPHASSSMWIGLVFVRCICWLLCGWDVWSGIMGLMDERKQCSRPTAYGHASLQSIHIFDRFMCLWSLYAKYQYLSDWYCNCGILVYLFAFIKCNIYIFFGHTTTVERLNFIYFTGWWWLL